LNLYILIIDILYKE